MIKLVLTGSILLLVFALGLRARLSDAASLLRELFRPPHRLLRAIVAMFLVVPLVAVLAAKHVDLSLPVRTAIVAMAVAPIPPILPGKQLRFGGDSSYVFGLLVAISLVAIVVVPLSVQVMAVIFDRRADFGVVDVGKLIGVTILVPLVAGIAVRSWAGAAAERLASWAARLGTVLLVSGLVPVLIAAWPAMASMIRDGGVVAIGLVVAAALAAGHALGGPAPEERTNLAIASSMRHPGVAAAIASLGVPEEPRAQAAILLYLLVAAIATSVYGIARKRQSAIAR
ncbi:MAG: hypothetical protein KJ018_07645 [Burkholderiales bacterium]|nr:hypothetical protein [Burkholderiales bacterium]